jgi:hypothetical protein
VNIKLTETLNMLLVVKTTKGFSFKGYFIGRKILPKGGGTHARISWPAIATADKINDDYTID